MWHPLTFALVSNDLDLAAEKKHTIEEWQRRLRREREERGEEWEPEEFVPTGAVTELGTPIFRHIEERYVFDAIGVLLANQIQIVG